MADLYVPFVSIDRLTQERPLIVSDAPIRCVLGRPLEGCAVACLECIASCNTEGLLHYDVRLWIMRSSHTFFDHRGTLIHPWSSESSQSVYWTFHKNLLELSHE